MKEFLFKLGVWMLNNIIGILGLPLCIITLLCSYIVSFIALLCTLFKHTLNKDGIICKLWVNNVINAKDFYYYHDNVYITDRWVLNYNLTTIFCRVKFLALGYTKNKTYEIYDKLKEEGYIEKDA